MAVDIPRIQKTGDRIVDEAQRSLQKVANVIDTGLPNLKYQTFTANGTFSLPANVSILLVAGCGGGAGGAGGSDASLPGNNRGVGGGGGGGGAEFIIRLVTDLTAGLYHITIGQGGAGGAQFTNGSDGSDSEFYFNNSGDLNCFLRGGSKGYAIRGFNTVQSWISGGNTARGSANIFDGLLKTTIPIISAQFGGFGGLMGASSDGGASPDGYAGGAGGPQGANAGLYSGGGGGGGGGAGPFGAGGAGGAGGAASNGGTGSAGSAGISAAANTGAGGGGGGASGEGAVGNNGGAGGNGGSGRITLYWIG